MRTARASARARSEGEVGELKVSDLRPRGDGPAENLAATSYQFKRNATTLKREMRWKNIRFGLILGGVVLVVIVLVISTSVGGKVLGRGPRSGGLARVRGWGPARGPGGGVGVWGLSQEGRG